MPIPKYGWLAVFACLLITACSSNKNIQQPVEDAILGTWCEPDEREKSCIGYMVYQPDGTYYAYGAFQEYDVAYESWGDWRVAEDRFCVTPRKRSFSRLSTGLAVYPDIDLKPYCQRVQSIGDSELILSHEEGDEITLFRVSNEPDENLEPGAEVPKG